MDLLTVGGGGGAKSCYVLCKEFLGVLVCVGGRRVLCLRDLCVVGVGSSHEWCVERKGV